jgi:hypothetical protein
MSCRPAGKRRGRCIRRSGARASVGDPVRAGNSITALTGEFWFSLFKSDHSGPAPGPMAFRFLYRRVRRALELAGLRFGTVSSKERGDRCLRHQLVTLRRQVAQPRFDEADRAILAALSRVVPRQGLGAFLVRPETLLAGSDRWWPATGPTRGAAPVGPPRRPPSPGSWCAERDRTQPSGALSDHQAARRPARERGFRSRGQERTACSAAARGRWEVPENPRGAAGIVLEPGNRDRLGQPPHPQRQQSERIPPLPTAVGARSSDAARTGSLRG